MSEVLKKPASPRRDGYVIDDHFLASYKQWTKRGQPDVRTFNGVEVRFLQDYSEKEGREFFGIPAADEARHPTLQRWPGDRGSLPGKIEFTQGQGGSSGESKPSNPKDAVGIKKVPFSVIPWGVIGELGIAMLEGALKYGRHNYRSVGVRASVYVDASIRHITSFWEGEDIDGPSRISHITKAIASLTVLRDGMMRDLWVDDRPPKLGADWMKILNSKAEVLIEGNPNPQPAITALPASTKLD